MLKPLKLRDICNAHVIKFYYKLKHGCLPSYFNSFRLTSQDQIHTVHTYGTRLNYIIPANVTRTQFAQNCLRNKQPMVINSSGPNIIQKIYMHSYKGLSWYLKTITTRNYSFCKIEFLYYINLSSSTRDTIICDYNQSARRIRLKIPVACLVLLGMICITISSLSYLCMYVYCNNVFDNTV